MYKTRESLITPKDSTILWRYMDLSQFLWLLSEASLYFSPLTEFKDQLEGDQWEGAIPAGLPESLVRHIHLRDSREAKHPAPQSLEHNPILVDIAKKALKEVQKRFRINCWHLNEVESVAMWKLYTRGVDGVAIQTTVERLKAAVLQEMRDVFIGEVSYRDHARPDEKSTEDDYWIVPVKTKRRSYKHESEVRLILEEPSPHQDSEQPVKLKGVTLKVDPLSNWIERIVVSPRYPEWARSSLQTRVTDAELKVNVEKSDLLMSPEL